MTKINVRSYAENKVFELLGRKIELIFCVPILDKPDNTGNIFGSCVKILPYKDSYIKLREAIYMDLNCLYDMIFGEEDDIDPPTRYIINYLETGNLNPDNKTKEDLFMEILDAYIKHEVGHIISINRMLEADPSAACDKYQKLMEDAYARYKSLPEATDLQSMVEMKKVYYDIELEKMANDVFGLTYLDL